MSSSGGERDLSVLLRTMRPVLNDGEFIFSSISEAVLAGIPVARVIGLFRESEGVTVVLNRTYADSIGLKYDFVAAWVTLTVHSSLEAAGLTAAFAGALGKANISCNVMAAFYHDHIFVPLADAQRAMEVLTQLSESQE